MDRAIRNQEKFKNKNKDQEVNDEIFLHRSCQPIDEVDFTKEKNKKQLDFEFGILNECEGMCGN
jgi:hypothetical protein